MRSSSVPRCEPPTSAARCASSSASIPRSPSASASPTSTSASTTPPTSATFPPSSPDSTAWRFRPMPPASAVSDTFLRSGKVRDLYAVGDDRLLLVASDRLSAFDVVLPTPIPDKGRVLTGISRFWFDRTSDLVANHLVGVAPEDIPAGSAGPTDAAERDELRGRMMLCRRVEPLKIEVIVRGYLAGSGWKDYGRTGAVCGIPLPTGLRESDRMPEPLFTPWTKAEEGHDENISLDEARAIVGRETADRVAELAIALYRRGAEIAEPKGV